MKKIYIIIVTCILVLILGRIIKTQIFDSGNKPLEYSKAVDEVFSSDINGMSIMVMTTTKVLGNEVNIHLSAVGNSEDRFSSNSNDGVKLWAVKQLFLRLKDLDVQREGDPDMFPIISTGYYVIEANLDYINGKKITDIHYLNMFVNTQNYNIYIPKDYISLEELRKSSVRFKEYKADSIAKYLIDTIVKL